MRYASRFCGGCSTTKLILLAKSGSDRPILVEYTLLKLSEEGRYMLKPDKYAGIPEMTRLIAREAFPQGNIFLTMRDELRPIFEDEQFCDLYPALGQPAVSPARLALVTVMQFVENLTDRQAAQAVRARIDWKYALGLELSDPGFNYSILSEFRSRLIEGGAEQLLLEKILEQCEARGLLGGKKKQRTDSTHVMAAIRVLNFFDLVIYTMYLTL